MSTRLRLHDDVPSAEPLQLASGRRAQFERHDGDDVLTVSAVDGRVELSVRFTAAGPLLTFEAAGIRLESPGEVTVACERFRVEANDSLELRSAGSIEAVAQGEAVVRAEGAVQIEGHAVEVSSRRGNVDLKANDDVRLRGERIKLNC